MNVFNNINKLYHPQTGQFNPAITPPPNAVTLPSNNCQSTSAVIHSYVTSSQFSNPLTHYNEQNLASYDRTSFTVRMYKFQKQKLPFFIFKINELKISFTEFKKVTYFRSKKHFNGVDIALNFHRIALDWNTPVGKWDYQDEPFLICDFLIAYLIQSFESQQLLEAVQAISYSPIDLKNVLLRMSILNRKYCFTKIQSFYLSFIHSLLITIDFFRNSAFNKLSLTTPSATESTQSTTLSSPKIPKVEALPPPPKRTKRKTGKTKSKPTAPSKNKAESELVMDFNRHQISIDKTRLDPALLIEKGPAGPLISLPTEKFPQMMVQSCGYWHTNKKKWAFLTIDGYILRLFLQTHQEGLSGEDKIYLQSSPFEVSEFVERRINALNYKGYLKGLQNKTTTLLSAVFAINLNKKKILSTPISSMQSALPPVTSEMETPTDVTLEELREFENTLSKLLDTESNSEPVPIITEQAPKKSVETHAQDKIRVGKRKHPEDKPIEIDENQKVSFSIIKRRKTISLIQAKNSSLGFMPI